MFFCWYTLINIFFVGIPWHAKLWIGDEQKKTNETTLHYIVCFISAEKEKMKRPLELHGTCSESSPPPATLRGPCAKKRHFFPKKNNNMGTHACKTDSSWANSLRWVPCRIVWAVKVKFQMRYLLTGQCVMDLGMRSLTDAGKSTGKH